MELISRNARITPDLLASQTVSEPIDPKEIKLKWLRALQEAHELVEKLNPQELGCLYVNKKGEVRHRPTSKDKPHFGLVRGSWPVVLGEK